MERPDDVWKLIRQRRAAGQPLSDHPMPYETDTPPEPDAGVPGCPICRGFGWVQGPMRREGEARVFPALPCPCRQPAIEAARGARLRAAANLPHERRPDSSEDGDYEPRTFANLRTPRSAGDDFAAVVNAARRFAEGEGEHILTFTGVYGSGKSHIVEAVCRRLLERMVSVRYEFVPDLLDRIRATYRPDAEEQTSDVLAQYRDVEVLALDDLGAHNSTAWARTQIVSLVDSRYRTGGRLIVATNLLSPAAMAKDMGEGRVASRLFERSSTVCVAWVNAGDYRLEGQP